MNDQTHLQRHNHCLRAARLSLMIVLTLLLAGVLRHALATPSQPGYTSAAPAPNIDAT